MIGGIIFVGSQAWEWKNFISGEYGAVTTKGGNILQFVDGEGHRVALKDIAVPIKGDRVEHQANNGIWFDSGETLPTYSLEEVKAGFMANGK